jgi:O-antigen/teichoic acid export membrane protein
MTDHPPSLRRNFSWTFLGNAFYALCLWGMFSLLTKLGSKDIAGRFALGSAISTPFIIFAGLQFRVVMATDAKNAFEFRDYLGIRLVLLPVAFLLVVAVAVLGYNRDQAMVICMFGLVRIVESFIDLFYGFAQKHERMDIIARSLWLRGVSAFLLFGGVFWATGDLALSLAANALAWILTFLFFDVPNLKMLVASSGEATWLPRWSKSTFREIVWLTLPLGAVMLLITLRNTIPRTFLEQNLGEDVLGVFSAMSYLVVAGSTVIMAMSQSSLARLSRYFAEGQRDAFRSTILKILGIGVLIGVAGVLMVSRLGSFILGLVYSSDYATNNDVFVVIMIGGALFYLGSLLGAPVSAMRVFRVQLLVYLINICLMVVLCWKLIPAHGMMGAAITMAICAFWVTSAYGFLVWRGIRNMPEQPPTESLPTGGEAP